MTRKVVLPMEASMYVVLMFISAVHIGILVLKNSTQRAHSLHWPMNYKENTFPLKKS